MVHEHPSLLQQLLPSACVIVTGFLGWVVVGAVVDEPTTTVIATIVATAAATAVDKVATVGCFIAATDATTKVATVATTTTTGGWLTAITDD